MTTNIFAQGGTLPPGVDPNEVVTSTEVPKDMADQLHSLGDGINGSAIVSGLMGILLVGFIALFIMDSV